MLPHRVQYKCKARYKILGLAEGLPNAFTDNRILLVTKIMKGYNHAYWLYLDYREAKYSNLIRSLFLTDPLFAQ